MLGTTYVRTPEISECQELDKGLYLEVGIAGFTYVRRFIYYFTKEN